MVSKRKWCDTCQHINRLHVGSRTILFKCKKNGRRIGSAIGGLTVCPRPEWCEKEQVKAIMQRLEHALEEQQDDGVDGDLVRLFEKTLCPELVKNQLIPQRVTTAPGACICLGYRAGDIFIYVEFEIDGNVGIIAADKAKKKCVMNVDVDVSEAAKTLQTALALEKEKNNE